MLYALLVGGVADVFIGIGLVVLVKQHKVYVAERTAWRVAEGLQMRPDDI